MTGFKVLIFCGCVLAAALTVFLALSLTARDVVRTLLHTLLLWITVSLIGRNLDNLARARTSGSKDGDGWETGRRTAGPGSENRGSDRREDRGPTRRPPVSRS